jgi:hypothetical protein
LENACADRQRLVGAQDQRPVRAETVWPSRARICANSPRPRNSLLYLTLVDLGGLDFMGNSGGCENRMLLSSASSTSVPPPSHSATIAYTAGCRRSWQAHDGGGVSSMDRRVTSMLGQLWRAH